MCRLCFAAPSLQLDENGTWVNAADTCRPPNSAYDPTTRVYTVDICHFSSYALFFQQPPVAVVRAARVVQLTAAANVTFDATASYDPDTTYPLVSFSWELSTPVSNTSGSGPSLCPGVGTGHAVVALCNLIPGTAPLAPCWLVVARAGATWGSHY